MTNYAPPVRRLFEIGRPDPRRSDTWIDYVSDVGLSAENVDELARIVGDLSVDQHEDEDSAFWARIHAWRALGQLRAETSVEALISCVKASDGDDDWASSELPGVFGMIGGATIPALLSLFDDPLLTDMSLMTVADCLKEIGTQNPDYRVECADILTDVLKTRSSPPFANGCIIACLLDLKAVAAIDVIRDAFQRNVVDCSVAGDLEDVEVNLGLKASRSTPRPFYPLFPGHTPDMFSRPRAATRVNAVAVKTGRNDPCPCGSGKKYKKCCLQ